MGEEYDAVCGGAELLQNLALQWVEDAGQQLSCVDLAADFHKVFKNTCALGTHGQQLGVADDGGQIAVVGVVVNDALLGQEAQDTVYGIIGTFWVDFRGGGGEQTEGFGVPDLPIVVEGA